MADNSFLLYGANGYSGQLIGRYAAEYDLQPILAGRREEALAPLAARLKTPHMVFDVNDSSALTDALKKVTVVLNERGPFTLLPGK